MYEFGRALWLFGISLALRRDSSSVLNLPLSRVLVCHCGEQPLYFLRPSAGKNQHSPMRCYDDKIANAECRDGRSVASNVAIVAID